jgi:hypothetical protein
VVRDRNFLFGARSARLAANVRAAGLRLLDGLPAAGKANWRLPPQGELSAHGRVKAWDG